MRDLFDRQRAAADRVDALQRGRGGGDADLGEALELADLDEKAARAFALAAQAADYQFPWLHCQLQLLAQHLQLQILPDSHHQLLQFYSA